MITYAAVQHAPQQISIDALLNGKYLHQVAFWYSSRGAAKAALADLCQRDGVQPFSSMVIALPLNSAAVNETMGPAPATQ